MRFNIYACNVYLIYGDKSVMLMLPVEKAQNIINILKFAQNKQIVMKNS